MKNNNRKPFETGDIVSFVSNICGRRIARVISDNGVCINVDVEAFNHHGEKTTYSVYHGELTFLLSAKDSESLKNLLN